VALRPTKSERSRVAESSRNTRNGWPAWHGYNTTHIGFAWALLYIVILSGCSGWVLTAAAQTMPSLTVTPSSPINISGAQGGPFSPASIQYRLSASAGTIRFAVTPPFWLTADPRVGTVGADGVTVTLSTNTQALKLAPRAYDAPAIFTNLTNGRGTTRRTAKLIIQRSTTPSASPSGGFLLDDIGGVLRDNHGAPLIAR
jgi:hypothetical protein